MIQFDDLEDIDEELRNPGDSVDSGSRGKSLAPTNHLLGASLAIAITPGMDRMLISPGTTNPITRKSAVA